jgi:hypothetical protein
MTGGAVVTVGLSSALCAILTAPALAQTDPNQPEPAAAAGPRDHSWTRQVAVEGQVGYGAPLGYVGLAVDADVLPWLSISGGLGTDLFEVKYLPLYVSHQEVRQLALMPRLRLPVLDGATFVTLGVGISRDPGSSTELLDTARVRQDDELGFEHRFDNGLRARAFAGIGVGLNDPHRWAYAGAALGYAVVPNPDQSSVPGPWYGWQPLLSDALAVVVAADGSPSHEAARAAVAIYALTPVVIHVAHHNYVRAVLSAALRTTLMYLALHINDNSPGTDYDVRGSGPAIVAGTVAALVDDLALSWK